MFKESVKKLKQKENVNTELKEEISRRKYVEAKVQAYVATLIRQNAKFRETLEWILEKNQVGQSVQSLCEFALEDNEDGEGEDFEE